MNSGKESGLPIGEKNENYLNIIANTYWVNP